MCCLLTIFFIFGPRVTAFLWYLVDTTRWNNTFDNLLVPCLGLLFLPFTLLAYVLVGAGGVEGLEWIVIVVAFLIDIGGTSGGAYRNRERIIRVRG